MDGLGILSIVALFGGFPLAPGAAQPIQEWGVDGLQPIHADRRIDTTNLQWRGWRKDLPGWRTELRLGATATRASGHIRQLDGRFEDGTLHELELDSAGWGLGPAAEARVRLLQRGPLALDLDLSVAVLLYDRRFPAGGDRYNGMIQAGPRLQWQLSSETSIGLGWRWMHVSNGQGVVPRNPSYEARGLTLRLQRAV